jgi:hypothetical protein
MSPLSFLHPLQAKSTRPVSGTQLTSLTAIAHNTMPVLTAPDEHTLALPVLSEQEVSQAIEKLTQHMLSVQNAEAMGPATHAAWSAETDVYCKVIDELVR